MTPAVQPNGEAVGFKKESQRAENVRVVVNHIDRWFCEGRHRESPRIFRADPDRHLSSLARGSRPGFDLSQSLSRPARIANRTSSERLLACIFVITFAL